MTTARPAERAVSAVEVAVLFEVVGSLGVPARTEAVFVVLRATRSGSTRATRVTVAVPPPASEPTAQLTSCPLATHLPAPGTVERAYVTPAGRVSVTTTPDAA